MCTVNNSMRDNIVVYAVEVSNKKHSSFKKKKKEIGRHLCLIKQHIQHSEVHEARNVPGGVTSSKMLPRKTCEKVAEVTSSEMIQSWSGENMVAVTSSEMAQGSSGQSNR